MGVTLPAYNKEQPPEWCAKYIGIPYEMGARGPDKIDCWGLLVVVLRDEFGLNPPTYDGVDWSSKDRASRLACAKVIRDERALHWQELVPGEERAGDAVVLLLGAHPLHVGVVAGPGWMLHTDENAESGLERYDGLLWRNRIDGFFRLAA